MLHVLFDLKVQSLLNKNKTNHHKWQKHRSKPERTTAFPPARNAVLTQAEINTKANSKTQPAKTAKNDESRPNNAVQVPNKKSVAHSDSEVLTRLKILV